MLNNFFECVAQMEEHLAFKGVFIIYSYVIIPIFIIEYLYKQFKKKKSISWVKYIKILKISFFLAHVVKRCVFTQSKKLIFV